MKKTQPPGGLQREREQATGWRAQPLPGQRWPASRRWRCRTSAGYETDGLGGPANPGERGRRDWPDGHEAQPGKKGEMPRQTPNHESREEGPRAGQPAEGSPGAVPSNGGCCQSRGLTDRSNGDGGVTADGATDPFMPDWGGDSDSCRGPGSHQQDGATPGRPTAGQGSSGEAARAESRPGESADGEQVAEAAGKHRRPGGITGQEAAEEGGAAVSGSVSESGGSERG